MGDYSGVTFHIEPGMVYHLIYIWTSLRHTWSRDLFVDTDNVEWELWNYPNPTACE